MNDSRTPITVRELIKQLLDSGVGLDANVYLNRNGDFGRGVWFAAYKKKLGEGGVIVIRECEP